ncbi:hypothetical protein [Actinoplanes sp. NPDC051851]|uniref:hypothetical protein n=1 Tax=Actinoplanes sp. NPDC051851 TaxID=3154753 RepID=UPI00342FA133
MVDPPARRYPPLEAVPAAVAAAHLATRWLTEPGRSPAKPVSGDPSAEDFRLPWR